MTNAYRIDVEACATTIRSTATALDNLGQAVNDTCTCLDAVATATAPEPALQSALRRPLSRGARRQSAPSSQETR